MPLLESTRNDGRKKTVSMEIIPRDNLALLPSQQFKSFSVYIN